MRYLSRLSTSPSERLRRIIDAQWNVIRGSVHLIASACYPFPITLDALSEPSSILPVEGAVGSRYLPGAKAMDEAEAIGERLVLHLMGCENGYRANLQPHSGTQANQVVFNASLRDGDTVLSLAPTDGGHVSHKVLIGRRNRSVNYSLGPDGTVDFGHLDDLARAHKPRLIIVGGSAIPREIDFATCYAIARDHGAMLHADVSHTATFIASGHHAAIAGHADFITFNTVKNLRGPNSGIILYRSEFHDRINRAVFPDTQGGANEASLLAKVATFDEWTRHDLRGYAERVLECASILARELMTRGVPIVTNGTDSHIVLVDLRKYGQTGAAIEMACERAGVLLNRNLVPGDGTKPWVTSGVRIGSANVAILGYAQDDLVRLATALVDSFVTGDEPDRGVVADLVERYQIERAM